MIGFVVGLTAEARIAARFGCPVGVGGGTPAGARDAAAALIGDGATALVSFGLAGGLDPVLRPGAVIVPSAVLMDGERLDSDALLADRFGGFSGHVVLAGCSVAVDAAEKRRLFVASRAHAIDLESGVVARVALDRGVPFAVVRAICDSAERDLPPAALIALNSAGKIGLLRVLGSVVASPGQIPGLIALARDAALARRALFGLVEKIGSMAGAVG